MPNGSKITKLGGKKVDRGKLFKGYVPGGNWVTVRYRFPLGPPSELDLGRLQWRGK